LSIPDPFKSNRGANFRYRCAQDSVSNASNGGWRIV